MSDGSSGGQAMGLEADSDSVFSIIVIGILHCLFSRVKDESFNIA